MVQTGWNKYFVLNYLPCLLLPQSRCGSLSYYQRFPTLFHGCTMAENAMRVKDIFRLLQHFDLTGVPDNGDFYPNY